MTALLECLTALLEYLDLLQCLKITVLGHVHLSACNINNSPHKLGFQFSMRAGDQKLRFDLVWPYRTLQCWHQTENINCYTLQGTPCMYINLTV